MGGIDGGKAWVKNLDPEIVLPPTDVMGTLSLVGRSLLVLAGAFLLRALTEGGTISPAVGGIGRISTM